MTNIAREAIDLQVRLGQKTEKNTLAFDILVTGQSTAYVSIVGDVFYVTTSVGNEVLVVRVYKIDELTASSPSTLFEVLPSLTLQAIMKFSGKAQYLIEVPELYLEQMKLKSSEVKRTISDAGDEQHRCIPHIHALMRGQLLLNQFFEIEISLHRQQ